MNYTYKINMFQNGFNVIEFRHYPDGEIAETIWEGWYFLKYEINYKSFFRAKKWLVDNHPELML